MTHTTDIQLVQQARDGNRAAFSKLVQKHQNYAYGAAIGMLSDFDLAQDVVQEAFICAYRDLNKLQDPALFGGWLRGIVRNMAHRALRELGKVQKLADELSIHPVTMPKRPDENLEEAERSQIVKTALTCLNDKNREVISLYYVACLSYADIASYLNVSETAVQGRLQRARVQLRKELKMVREKFQEKHLPADFTTEIETLLDEALKNDALQAEAVQKLAQMGEPAVDPLCELLGDLEHPARYIAARALCEIKDPRALQPILRLLYAHGRHWWRKNTFKVFEFKRILAVPGMREALLKVIRERQPDQGIMAFQVLEHAKGDDEVYNTILDVFQNTRNKWQRVALHTLCVLDPKRAQSALKEALQNEKAGFVNFAIREARRLEENIPLDICLEVFKKRTSAHTLNMTADLIFKHGDGGVNVLKDLMHNGAPADRARATLVLFAHDDDDAIRIIKTDLLGLPADADVDLNTLSSLEKHLAENNPEQTGPLVEGFLEIVNYKLCGSALDILVHQKGLKALPQLQKSLSHARPRSTKTARKAFRLISKLGDQAAPEVETWLNDEDWMIRKAAASLLKRWDKLTPDLVQKLAKDPHKAVQHAARWRT